MKKVVEVDGEAFSTLEEFFEHFSRVALGGALWGRNLDAFNDVLRGGFGTPEGGFVLRWKNHEVSRERLGFAETVRQLRKRLTTCHPRNVGFVEERLEEALAGEGGTVFDWLVEIIEVHGPRGAESEDGVELELR